MEKIVLSPKEAAAALDTTLPNIYTLCRRADFPSIRISPRRIVIPADALTAWLEKQVSNKE